MSAIRKLIEGVRRGTDEELLPGLADAAEAELKELEEIAAVQRRGVQAMAAQLAERDRPKAGCPACKGKGGSREYDASHHASNWEPCSKCNGTGKAVGK